MNEFVFL